MLHTPRGLLLWQHSFCSAREQTSFLRAAHLAGGFFFHRTQFPVKENKSVLHTPRGLLLWQHSFCSAREQASFLRAAHLAGGFFFHRTQFPVKEQNACNNSVLHTLLPLLSANRTKARTVNIPFSINFYTAVIVRPVYFSF